MNLPAGKTIENRKKLSETNILEILTNLFKETFTGYLVITTEGKNGISEGLLLFQKGSLKGAIFQNINEEKDVLGEEALTKILNSFASQQGIIDVNELSKQQAELVIAFEEKMQLSKEYSLQELKRKIPKKYEQASEETKEETKLDILKKLGLLGMERK